MRKLRNEEETNTITAPRIPQSKIVRTTDGQQAILDPDLVNFESLLSMKPYVEGEQLPPAIVKTNSKKISYVVKPGEPRFYFNRNELIMVYMGLSKKRKLWWVYDEKKPVHKKIRTALRKQGIPGA